MPLRSYIHRRMIGADRIPILKCQMKVTTPAARKLRAALNLGHDANIEAEWVL